MYTTLHVDNVTFTAAAGTDRSRGLVGWVSCEIGGALRLDGIAVRRTRDDRIVLSFPEHTDRRGERHPYMRPIDHASRLAIEEQVLSQLPGGLS